MSGPYELLAPLGRGGWAEVFRARAPDGREVALKRPLPGLGVGAEQADRFQREAAVLRALSHPGIVRLLAAGSEGGRPWLAYELVEGALPLDRAFARAGTRERVRMVRDASLALGAAHAQGVVHRDVTPGNVLVDARGQVRVADFGLAAMAGLDPLTASGVVVGTPGYVAPELALDGRAATSPRCDVWSLGVLLFLGVTGRHPFEGRSFYELVHGAVAPPSLRSSRPEVGADLEAACRVALSLDPAARPADGAALATLLERALAEPGLDDGPAGPPPLRGPADAPGETLADPRPPGPARPPRDADVPRAVGRYLLEAPLAHGGSGVVYRARDPETGAPVAVKFLLALPDPEGARRRRFEREAQALRRIVHPNVVGLREVGVHAQCPYVVLDFVDGRSLEDLLSEGPLEPDQAARLVRSLARALAAVHREGVVHRDLKPDNVVIDRAGTPFVIDLGLAAVEAEDRARLTASGAVLGTLGYLAPEQARGEAHAAGPALDVYGLGGVLYAALTGDPPCPAPTQYEALVAAVERVPVAPAQRRGDVSAELSAICMRCLEKDPARRYASAEALAAALDGLLAGREPGSRPRPRWARWAGAAALLALLGGGAVLRRPAALTEPPHLALLEPDGRTPRVERLAEERARALAAARGVAGEPRWEDVRDARQAVLELAVAWAAREPERAAAQLALAAALEHDGQGERALEALDRALDLDPGLVPAWELRARWRLSRAAWQEAAQAASQALDRRPGDRALLALRGRARALGGDVSGGRADLERAVAGGLEEPEALALLAHCLLSQERTQEGFRQAEALADRALALAPGHAQALAARAKARLWHGDDAGAEADFATLAASRGEPAAGARLRRGLALLLAGRQAEARAALEDGDADPALLLWRAALFDPEAARPLNAAAGWQGLLARGLVAGQLGEEVRSLAGDDPQRRCQVGALAGALAERQGRVAEARAHYAEAVASDARGEPGYDWALRRARALAAP